MQLTWEQFDKVINKKLRYNQMLLCISVLFATVFFFIQRDNLLWSIYFVIIGSLSLPNINRCKEDRMLFQNNKLQTKSGKVLDVFPERDGGTSWIIFLESDSLNKKKENLLEFIVPEEPKVKENESITVHYTPKMSIPVRIEVNHS
jgi:hypothetical protein